MNGINLTELAGLVTAIGALLGAVFLWTGRTSDAQTKAHESQVSDLRNSIATLREDFGRQMQDMKGAMTHQAQIVERQEIMLSDYSRHVAKLERIMMQAGLQIPEFETSTLRGGIRA